METMELPCKLTQQELLERGRQVADLVRQHAALEDEKKRTAADIKAKLDSIGTQVEELSAQITTGCETRRVEVSRSSDFARGVEETFRSDTGELVYTRALSPEERQGALFPLDGGRRTSSETAK